MCFDRYEIHIQAFGSFFYMNLHHFLVLVFLLDERVRVVAPLIALLLCTTNMYYERPDTWLLAIIKISSICRKYHVLIVFINKHNGGQRCHLP